MKIGDFYVGVAARWACAGLAVTALTAFSCRAALAQSNEEFPVVQGVRFGQVTHEFERTFFSNNPDFATNRTLTGQLKRIFGPFPENSMFRDARAINRLYQETFFKQMNSGPILRTIDLPSPFQSSLRTLPPPAVVAPIEPPPIVVTPPIVPPVAPPPAARPVPALW